MVMQSNFVVFVLGMDVDVSVCVSVGGVHNEAGGGKLKQQPARTTHKACSQ